MITRRRLLMFGLLVGLITLGVGGWMLWESMEARTVRPGMTFDEAKAILGDDPIPGSAGQVVWLHEDGQIIVYLDFDLVVTSVEYQHEPLFDRVRRWIHL